MSKKTLHILWVNDNPITAENMVFMYATNALLQGWWKKVHLIIWGATVKLICDDAKLQELLKKFHDAGGHVSACKRCAENLGCLEQIEKVEGLTRSFTLGNLLQKFLRMTKSFLPSSPNINPQYLAPISISCYVAQLSWPCKRFPFCQNVWRLIDATVWFTNKA